MDFKKLLKQIERFKDIYQKYYVEKMQESIPNFHISKPIFEFKNQAKKEDINLLEIEIKQILPSELKFFYTEVGQLMDENQPENLTISIPSITNLLSLKGNSRWSHTPTFGLIDMMKLHWANDRYELNEGEFFTTEQIKTLNENYTCIGYWCNYPFYEETYFIFFDKKHQFSEIKYNQNQFESLQVDLLEIIENGISNKSFEELLNFIFIRLEEYTIEYGKNW